MLSIKGRSKRTENCRLLFCWKDILLYLDTCHLISRHEVEKEKVDGGDSCVHDPYGKPHQKLFFHHGHPLPLGNFCRCSCLTSAPGIYYPQPHMPLTQNTQGKTPQALSFLVNWQINPGQKVNHLRVHPHPDPIPNLPTCCLCAPPRGITDWTRNTPRRGITKAPTCRHR